MNWILKNLIPSGWFEEHERNSSPAEACFGTSTVQQANTSETTVNLCRYLHMFDKPINAVLIFSYSCCKDIEDLKIIHTALVYLLLNYYTTRVHWPDIDLMPWANPLQWAKLRLLGNPKRSSAAINETQIKNEKVLFHFSVWRVCGVDYL